MSEFCGMEGPESLLTAEIPTSKNTWNVPSKQRSRSEKLPVWDIPSAIPKTVLNRTELEFESKKKLLASRLPILSLEDIARERLPYHIFLINDLERQGYLEVAKEMKVLLRKQECQNNSFNSQSEISSTLEQNQELLDAIADALKYCADAVRNKQIVIAINVRKVMAEHMIKMNKTWIAKHFYRICLDLSFEVPIKIVATQLRSEVKCILGFLEMDQAEKSDWATKVAIGYLEESRDLSKGQDWVFHSNIIVLKLRKPIYFYGLREDYTIINGNSMNLYSIATLMLNQVLLAKAGSIVFSSLPEYHTYESLGQALEFTNLALKLAQEVHANTAIFSAYITLGAIYLKQQQYPEALRPLQECQQVSKLNGDHEAEAISCSMIGCCNVGMRDTLSALENFVEQRDIADLHSIADLAVDALQNIGQVLLNEGQLVEAELCFTEAYHGFRSLKSKPVNADGVTENSWVKSGISAGLNLWGKFATHCRRNLLGDYEDIFDWKSYRTQPRKISRFFPDILTANDVFVEYNSDTKMPQMNAASMIKLLAGVKERGIVDPESLIEISNAIVDLRGKVRETKSKVKHVSILAGDSSDSFSNSTYLTSSTPYPYKLSDYDDSQYIIYESDLRPSVTKKGSYYEEGSSKWRLATTKTTSISDPNDPVKRITQSVALVSTSDRTSSNPEIHTFKTLRMTDTALEMLGDMDGYSDGVIIVPDRPDDDVVSEAKRISEFEREEIAADKRLSDHKVNRQRTNAQSYVSRADMARRKLRISDETKASPSLALWGLKSTFTMNRLSTDTEKAFTHKVLRLSEGPYDYDEGE